MWPIVGRPAFPDQETPEANAVVNLNGCTGTLIAPDVVLTAYHCFSGQLTFSNTRPFGRVGGMAATDGTVYVVTEAVDGTPARLWARDIAAPFHEPTAPPGGSEPLEPFVAMAPLSDREVLATGAGVSHYAVDVRTGAVRQVGVSSERVVAMATIGDFVYIATADDRIKVRDRGETGFLTFRDIGHAHDIVGMTAIDGTLYAVTEGGVLWRREPIHSDAPWIRMGHAIDVVFLTAVDGRLLCQTSNGQCWTRWPVPYGEPWQEAGRTDGFSAATIHGSRFVGTTERGELRLGDASFVWTDIGRGADITAMTAVNGNLYATTKSDRLLVRLADRTDRPWRDIGHAIDVVALGGHRSGRLFAILTSGQLWWRSTSHEERPWIRISDENQPPGVVAITVLDDMTTYVATSTAVFRRAGKDLLRGNRSYRRFVNAFATTDLSSASIRSPDDRILLFDRIGGNNSGRLWWYVPAEGRRSSWVVVPALGTEPGRKKLSPGKWHPFSDFGAPGLTVRFGVDATLSRRRAVAFQLAGEADIALLRLDRPVPRTVAIPKPVLTGPPPGIDDLSAFWARQTFRLVGWGRIEDGTLPSVRMQAVANGGGTYPAPGDPSRYHSWHKIHVRAGPLQGAGRPGDSGGPLFWRDESDREQVVGALNVAPGDSTTSRAAITDYAVTFSSGATDTAGIARPNTGDWIDTVLTDR